jgi:outer membrane protease
MALRTAPPRRAILILACLVLLGAAPSLAGQGGAKPLFSLSTSVGFLSGAAKEYVFDSSYVTDYKMSELDWASSPLLLWGIAGDLRFGDGIYARFQVASGALGKTGYMTDSDWQNYDGIKTNFSQSESWTDQALIVKISAGYDLRILDTLALGGFAEFGYLDFEWSARGGYLQYPVEIYPNAAYGPYTPITANTPITPVYGIGIIYRQSTIYPALGLRAAYRPSPGFGILASMAISPLVTMTTTDDHVLRSLIFSSTLRGGLLLEPSLQIDYRLSGTLGLSLRASYRSIRNLGGDLTQTDDKGAAFTNPGGGGASFEAFDFGLALGMTL